MKPRSGGSHSIDELASLATGRRENLFAGDLERASPRLVSSIAARRILVIGGAGSIGRSTIDVVARYKPAALHVVDQSENGLAELARSLRSDSALEANAELRLFPIDFGAPVMARILDLAGSYDAILNFAALKHVRSEKDVPSLVQMLDTNLVKNLKLMEMLAARDFAGRYFCVSTDKAANPVSLMGASKRIMEHLILSGWPVPAFQGQVTTARFANVAYSDGSLLYSFIQRLAKEQPISVPVDTQRYFVTPREAGTICTIAAFCAPPGTILAPVLDKVLKLTPLHEVANGFVRAHGLEPAIYSDEASARRAVSSEIAQKRYPVLRTPLDTSGEKPYEEFVGEGETVSDLGFETLNAISYVPPDRAALLSLLDLVRHIVEDGAATEKGDIVKAMSSVVPQFRHRETGRSLDDRI